MIPSLKILIFVAVMYIRYVYWLVDSWLYKKSINDQFLQTSWNVLPRIPADFSVTNMASNYISTESEEKKMDIEEENDKGVLILTQLPEELIEKILSLLSFNDLAEIRGVSNQTSCWRTVYSSPSTVASVGMLT